MEQFFTNIFKPIVFSARSTLSGVHSNNKNWKLLKMHLAATEQP